MTRHMTFDIVKFIIDAWDPVDLLSFAPADEYDDESRAVLSAYTDDPCEFGNCIYNIFRKNFDDSFGRSLQECINVAELIIGHK